MPSGTNMVWMNNTEYLGIPYVTPIPTTGYSWKNMLKDQIETYPRFTTTSITKKIVCPWGCNLYCIQRISMLNSINHTCSYINV